MEQRIVVAHRQPVLGDQARVQCPRQRLMAAQEPRPRGDRGFGRSLSGQYLTSHVSLLYSLRSQVIIAQEEDIAMTTTLTEQTLPTGTWTLDAVHSQVGYAVKHAGVSLFKGNVDGVDASLADGALN